MPLAVRIPRSVRSYLLFLSKRASVLGMCANVVPLSRRPTTEDCHRQATITKNRDKKPARVGRCTPLKSTLSGLSKRFPNAQNNRQRPPNQNSSKIVPQFVAPGWARIASICVSRSPACSRSSIGYACYMRKQRAIASERIPVAADDRHRRTQPA